MDLNLQGKNKQPKGSKVVKFKKGRKTAKFPKGTGLIYLGRIPHGFYEDQMTAYFSQFGRVLSAYIPRSKRSGRSKGYGFVEFEDEEVAKIAAESMNNYLMYNKVIKCRYIPPEERKVPTFFRKTQLSYPRMMNRIINAHKKRESLSKLSLNAYHKKTLHKIVEFKSFFEERGIDFNFKINTNDSKNSDQNSTATEKDAIKNSSTAEDEIDDEFGVLEIDASDNEIYFKIPPQVKKIIKKSSSDSVSSVDNKQAQKKLKIKRVKKLLAKEGQNAVKHKKLVKKIARNSEKKNKEQKKSLGKLSKTQESRTLRKKDKILLNNKEVGKKQTVGGAKSLKKNKNIKELNSAKLLTKKILSGKLSEITLIKKKISSVSISFYQF